VDDQQILEALAQQAPQPRPGWGEHVVHVARRARRRRKVAYLAAAIGSAAGIGAVSLGVLDGTAAQSGGAATAPAARAADPATGPYAASIIALAREMRRGLAGQWPVVFVLDRTCADVADHPVAAATCSPRPLGAKLRHDLAKALMTFARIEFVANRAAVSGRGPCPTVIHDGLLVILGPVRLGGSRAQVPISGMVDCLNGLGLTYRLAGHHGRWTIEGTTGTLWVS
jgi:hypothetical protein